MSEQNTVVIYTDGGCEPNPGVGGWGAVLIFGKARKELKGAALETTNNRMEMTAAIESLRSLTRPCTITLYTDSEYLRKGITEWLKGWKARGWKRKGGEVKNADLWKELDELVQPHKIDWRWVRGHTGVPENERCDELASEAIAELRAEAP